MKNIYRANLKLMLAIDSFVIFPTGDNDELLIYSHYVPEALMILRSGHYVYDTPKSIMTALERKEIKEGEKKRGMIFMPDLKNIISDIKVKEETNSSITIECDLFLPNKSDTIELAFCEPWMQEYIAVRPIEDQSLARKSISSISGERKYFVGFKSSGDTTVYTPFKF